MNEKEMKEDAHLTELEIHETALAGEARHDRAHHVTRCAGCAVAVEETRRLLASLEALGPEVEVPGELDDRLMRRIGVSSSDATKPRTNVGKISVGSWLLRAAAALILFGSGVAAHALWSGPGVPTSPAVTEAPTPGPALALQRAGTEYVAAIARLVADSSRLPEAELRRGREVAIATMSGAAFELRLLTNESEEAAEIHRVTKRARMPANERVSP